MTIWEHVCSECTYPPARHISGWCCDGCPCNGQGMTVAEEAAASIVVTGTAQEGSRP